MSDKKELEKIYEANKKIELHCSLKANPPLAGNYAKRLILGCKRALKIINKYDTDQGQKLGWEIEKLEDELASKGKIFVITYNLGARIIIHVSTNFIEYWGLKK